MPVERSGIGIGQATVCGVLPLWAETVQAKCSSGVERGAQSRTTGEEPFVLCNGGVPLGKGPAMREGCNAKSVGSSRTGSGNPPSRPFRVTLEAVMGEDWRLVQALYCRDWIARAAVHRIKFPPSCSVFVQIVC